MTTPQPQPTTQPPTQTREGQPGALTAPYYGTPVMDATAAQSAAQLPPDQDENFYTFAQSAARTAEIPQMAPEEMNGATLIRQRYDKEHAGD